MGGSRNHAALPDELGSAHADPHALCCYGSFGAGEGARTLDPDLGKVVLYH
jgi:hypothetical protein